MRNFLFIHNALERHYLRLIAWSMILPTLILGGCLYYIIFNLMAEQLGIPEVIAFHLLPVVDKVNLVIFISLPIVFLLLFIIGRIIARNLVGPIERIESELRKAVTSDRLCRIRVRSEDRLKPLVDDINAVIEKIKALH